jgi:hypothetical protein
MLRVMWRSQRGATYADGQRVELVDGRIRVWKDQRHVADFADSLLMSVKVTPDGHPGVRPGMAVVAEPAWRDGNPSAALVGKTTGTTTACQMAGCTGVRVWTVWPDGSRTRPCSKGMTWTGSEWWIGHPGDESKRA